MRFTLHYRGPLPANGGTKAKHQIRAHFHAQLKKLWGQPPLSEFSYLIQPRAPHQYCLLCKVGRFTFAPLITEEMNVIAEIGLTMLRPEPPGRLIGKGGDIDNRVKTLFDALSVPKENQLQESSYEEPFFCLLEDDHLVTAFSIRAEQLLEPEDEKIVDLTIDVKTRVTRQTFDNALFA